jgi:hypothetical protein
VEHPRYGSQPWVTGLNVKKWSNDVYFRAWTKAELDARRNDKGWVGINLDYIGFLIPGTAIAGDPAKQHGSCMLNTHYYDIERKCRDCGRLFLFYAEEQRYWYEELEFPVDADCVRCYPCRRAMQDIDRCVQRYEELESESDPPPDVQAELASLRVTLVQAGRFHVRQLEQVRAFLKRHPEHRQSADIRDRFAAIA